ncbi:ABC transporter substrate-binding protein [Chloroflexota bacterium]
MKIKLGRVVVFCLVSVVVLSLFTACAPPAEEAASSLIEVTDHAGRVVTIERMPEKIISLAPSITEIVYALGLEDKLVGVTQYCNYPEAAKDKPKIGGYSSVDLEKVVEIQPDLILATRTHRAEVIPELERLGLTVLDLYPTTIDEVMEAITLVGKCTGKENEASQLVTEIGKRIKAVTDKTDNLPESQRPRVFYVLWHDPLKTVGSDNRIHELIELAGGTNIAQDLSGISVTISLEAVIAANPEVIVASSGSGIGMGADLPLQLALTEPRLKGVAARINKQVYGMDNDLINRAGPRIADTLELLAKMIHPEIFGPP